MHLLDEFLAAPTWDDAVPAVLRRHSELFRDDARTRFEALMMQYGRTETARQVLLTYLEALQSIARRDSLALQSALRGGILPKLSKPHFTALSAITDVASARDFMTKFRHIGMPLLSGQVLHGDPFWLLLFALASRKNEGPREVPSYAKTTVGVGYNERRYRILKILPLSDGGFAVTAPYHHAHEGSLMKVPAPTATGTYSLDVGDTIPFHASDRVKLSYHKDGFVQFSGENSSRILSGRNEITGEPKGLGLMSRPLNSPVQSGPSVGCLTWGLANFEPWKVRGGEGAIIFEKKDDFYSEPSEQANRDTTDVCAIKIFVFPRDIVDSAVGPIHTADEISMPLPMNIYHRETPFRLKLISISPACVLGVIANRDPTGLPNNGFQLSGPGDGKHSLIAIYPSLPVADQGRDLDYTPGT